MGTFGGCGTTQENNPIKRQAVKSIFCIISNLIIPNTFEHPIRRNEQTQHFEPIQKSLAPLCSKYSSLSSCQHILLPITPKNKKPHEIRGVSLLLWYRAEH
jgi:hypothetical protein